jgi:hypothetical protein
MKAQFRAWSLLDGDSRKRSARKQPINMLSKLVFIREQCDAESEQRLETARQSCHPMSS